MKNLSIAKELYTEAFKSLGQTLVKSYLKVFSWFCFAGFGVVLYAFIYRILTGFAFV